MKKRTLTVLGLACLLAQASPLVAGNANQQPARLELAEQFSEYFSRQVKTANITGAAFAVATPEGIVRIGTEGHTDTSRKQPIDQDTTFRVASVSKTFAASLAGVLVDQGVFRWEDPVVRHVPGFRLRGDTGKVQVQHLLGQSSGLVPHAFDNLIEDGVPLERIQNRFSELSYICQPGKCYSYQNSVFSMIQPVIETTTRQSYSNLIQQKLFQPLDMQTASVGYKPLINNPNHARPHVKSRGRWKTVRVKPNYYRVAPAAGVNASVTDMGKWLTAQMGGNPAVLSPRVVEELTRPRIRTVRDTRRKYWRDMLTDAHYGLGWRVYRLGDHEIVYHSGWVSGYRADIAWSEEHGVGIAVLMNVEGSSISEMTTTFWKMAFDLLLPESSVANTALVAASFNTR
ncbi:MAG: beta-lactamase family protein [Gammaproteobacteria bacterium]|nr:beta-lactamase family protein [Gammaproteobacteria bacterium]